MAYNRFRKDHDFIQGGTDYRQLRRCRQGGVPARQGGAVDSVA